MKRTLIAIIIILNAMLLAACGGNGVNSSNANKTSNTANSGNASINDPLEPTKKTTETSATNAAPTLSPVIKAYCDAWVKNDEAGLRKVFSSDTLKAFEADMKAEKEKSLLSFLQDEKVSGTPCETSNEVITGDTATAIVKTNKTPNGVKRVFQKENGEWKLTNKVPDVESVKKAASNTGANNTK